MSVCRRWQEVVPADNRRGWKLTFSCECSGVGCPDRPPQPDDEQPRSEYLWPVVEQIARDTAAVMRRMGVFPAAEEQS